MPRLTPLQWLICAIAALGFAFDIYEVLMAPLVVVENLSKVFAPRRGLIARLRQRRYQ